MTDRGIMGGNITTTRVAAAACLAAILPLLGSGCCCGVPPRSVPGEFAFSEAGADDRPAGPAELGRYELDVLRAVNDIRRSRGVPELVPAGDLVGMARRQAADMIRMGRITHEGAEGSSLMDRAGRAGVCYRAIGENVAANRGYRDPAAETVRGWMASPPHKATIIHEVYREIGVAAVRCPETRTWYFVGVFCRRQEE